MTPAGAPTMFVIDGDAAVRAEQALVHKTSRAKTGGVINLTYVLAISSTDLGSMDVFARNPFIESIFTVRQLTFEFPKAYRLPVEGARGGADEYAAALAHVQHSPDIDRRDDPQRAVPPVGGHLSASDRECSAECTMHRRSFLPRAISEARRQTIIAPYFEDVHIPKVVVRFASRRGFQMTELEVSKLEIAREYLDAAIEFFLARTNFFCAIHLAAAAEELFGAHLLNSDDESDERIFTLAWKAQKALISETRPTPIDDKEADKEARNSVNKWKNEIKHMDEGACRTVTIDPAFMAEHYIEQALVNFYKLGLPKSAMIWRFEDHRNRKVHVGA